MKAKLVRTSRATSRTDPALVVERNGQRLIEAGSVIDHKDAYRLCQMGVARPEDDECLAALAADGWGPDVFEAKFAAAEESQRGYELGIMEARQRNLIAARERLHEDGQMADEMTDDEVTEAITKVASDDTGNPDQ